MKITSPANHPTVLEMYNNKREAADFREDVIGLTERLNDRFDDTLHEVIPPLFLSEAKDLMFYEALSAENRGKDELTTSYGHQRLVNNAEQNRDALKAMGLRARGEHRELRWTSDQVPESVKRDLGCDAIEYQLSRFGSKDFEVRAETKWVNSQPPTNGSIGGSGLSYYGLARIDGTKATLSESVRDGSRANVRWYTNDCAALDTDTRVRQSASFEESGRVQDSYQHVGPREISERLSEPTRDFHDAVTAEMGMPGWLTFNQTGL